ncbi:hypothetical protein GYMLUDRAFT_241962 [Collybiopsis luxurians FD-317 M1]|uniref:Peroxidase n=1 Tax=Collybiopsis luxurians FD-317 M1 TaxID=944289 RepID=A0A0D0CV68_9AGAR|nr:hypothetical protein GYMLUDRAFT_241962 [Collybiopsis luxurians FD-317 M1]
MKLTLVSLFAVSALQGVNSLPLFGFNFSFFPFFSPPSSSRPSPSKCFSCRGQRTSSIFINPSAQPGLPSAQQASSAAASAGLNLTNIQGDVLIGMKKNKELFFFFNIVDPKTFKSQLGASILPLITSTDQLLSVSTQPITTLNIAFSQKGLTALGKTDNLGDSLFSNGQLSDAPNLGDQTGNWVSAFAGTNIHGVLLLASDTVDNVNSLLAQIQTTLASSISEVYRIQGQARPGDQAGHEHFGYMDGISNPAISGFSTPLPGQAVIQPGIILVGEQGDTTKRPSWAKDGSFLAFRQLQQRVPEFNKFLNDNALSEPNLTAAQNAELLGARMMGRWKSGAPIDLAPLADDPTLAADPQRNNNFNFTHPGFDLTTDQSHCPFSAHIRKTNPRADLSGGNFRNHIIRAGIPYGPEVTDVETISSTSSTDPSLERGLAFVAYQSSIATGFKFLQQTWANNPSFHTSFLTNLPPSANSVGQDPIIGVASGGGARSSGGLDPLNTAKATSINQNFVISRGGEYFFTPSLSAIQNTLSV